MQGTPTSTTTIFPTPKNGLSPGLTCTDLGTPRPTESESHGGSQPTTTRERLFSGATSIAPPSESPAVSVRLVTGPEERMLSLEKRVEELERELSLFRNCMKPYKKTMESSTQTDPFDQRVGHQKPLSPLPKSCNFQSPSSSKFERHTYPITRSSSAPTIHIQRTTQYPLMNGPSRKRENPQEEPSVGWGYKGSAPVLFQPPPRINNFPMSQCGATSRWDTPRSWRHSVGGASYGSPPPISSPVKNSGSYPSNTPLMPEVEAIYQARRASSSHYPHGR